MRVGIIGPAQDALPELHRAVSLFLRAPDLVQVLYVGEDGAFAHTAEQLAGSFLAENEFLRHAAELAHKGSSEAIERLLSADREAARVQQLLRCLPKPPSCAIELIERWVILAVHDKAVLEERDVKNAHVIVYGHAPEADFKRFGPRSFLTPGPLHKGRIGSLDLRPDGDLEISLLDLAGKVQLRESLSLARGASKWVVSP